MSEAAIFPTMDAIISTRGVDMTGIVYVLNNKGMPGLLNIGRTDQEDHNQRISELYTTGVPFPFECVMAVEVTDNQQAKQLEEALHSAFEPHRVNPKREFFRIGESHVLAILKAWPDGKDVTSRTQQEVEASTGAGERVAVEGSKRRRPNMDFEKMSIPKGARLVFIGDGESTEPLEAIVVDNKKVEFQGEKMSLTRATNRALGKSDLDPIRPAPYWSYNGRTLDELYEEFHQQD